MLIHRFELYPALGKVAELRAVADEWANEARKLKIQVSTGHRWLSSEGAVTVWVSPYESMEAFEKGLNSMIELVREKGLRDRAEAASRQPLKNQLFDVLVPPAGPRPMPPLAHRGLVFPRTGSQAQVRELLTTFVQSQQKDGRPHFRLSALLFSPDGPVFAMGDSYESLTEYYAARTKRQPATRAMMEKVDPMTRAPLSQDIVRFDRTG